MNESMRSPKRPSASPFTADDMDLSNVIYKIYEQDDKTGSSFFEIWKKRTPQELMLKIMKKMGIQPGMETRTFKIVMCAALPGKNASRPYSVSYVDLPDDLDKDMSDKTRAATDEELEDGMEGIPDDMLDDEEGGDAGSGSAKYMALMMRSAMAANTKLMTEALRSQSQQMRDMNLSRSSSDSVVDTITKVVGALTPLVLPLMERLKPRDEGMKPVELIQMGLTIAQNASQKAVAPTAFDYFGMAAGVASGIGQVVAARNAGAGAPNPPALPPALPAPAPNPTPALPAPAAPAPNPTPAAAPAPAAAPNVPIRYHIYEALGRSVQKGDKRKLQSPSYWAERILCEWPEADLTEFTKLQSEVLVAEMGEAFAKNVYAHLQLTADHAKALGPLLIAVHRAVKSALTPSEASDNTNSEPEESNDDSDAATA